jgi:hypothetical protein
MRPTHPAHDACQEKNSLLPRLRVFWWGAQGARRNLARAPLPVRIVAIITILLPVLALTNLVYHVIRKPTELFFCRQPARQEAARDLAAIRSAVPRLFHELNQA